MEKILKKLGLCLAAGFSLSLLVKVFSIGVAVALAYLIGLGTAALYCKLDKGE